MHFSREAAMGDHYAPRKYLLGFCDADDKIWVYDRVRKNSFRTTLVNVAQENGFYSPEDERDLNQLVEMPANYVLNKLRDGIAISPDDREKLAVYIATFMHRVPYSRSFAASLATPALFAEYIDKIKDEIKKRGEELGIDAAIIDQRMTDVEAVRMKYADNPAAAVAEQIRSPWPGEKICQAVFGMKWRLLTTCGPSFFLTSDNPVFTFHSLGFAHAESELTFPVSTKLVLHGSWQDIRGNEIVPIDQQWVKEMNRRTASKSTRFLFYHKRENWVAALGDKNADGHQLNKIRW